MMTRFLLAILLSALGIRAILGAYSAPVRSDRELCIELAREVNISAEQGLLTQEEADAISARCYEMYGGE